MNDNSNEIPSGSVIKKSGTRKNRTMKRVKKEQQIARIEEHLLAGVSNVRTIAAAVGLSPSSVHRYIAAIYDRWLEENPEQSRQERTLRIRQLEGLAERALYSYERSCRDSVEVQKRKERRACPACEGRGERKDEPCNCCDGSGFVTVEHKSIRRKGQAGDSAHLRVAKECFAECARLKGLFRRPKEPKRKPQVHVHVTDKQLENAPEDVLLEVLSAHRKLAGPVIDVESEEV